MYSTTMKKYKCAYIKTVKFTVYEVDTSSISICRIVCYSNITIHMELLSTASIAPPFSAWLCSKLHIPSRYRHCSELGLLHLLLACSCLWLTANWLFKNLTLPMKVMLLEIATKDLDNVLSDIITFPEWYPMNSEVAKCMIEYPFSAELFTIRRESKFSILELIAEITGNLLIVKLLLISMIVLPMDLSIPILYTNSVLLSNSQALITTMLESAATIAPGLYLNSLVSKKHLLAIKNIPLSLIHLFGH